MELQQAGGRPEQAGWLDWSDISEEWSGEEETEIDTKQEIGVLTIQKRPPYNYEDLESLLSELET
jgi:hypothetical protein